LQTRRFAESFEPLNSSLPLSAPELHARAKSHAICFFGMKSSLLDAKELKKTIGNHTNTGNHISKLCMLKYIVHHSQTNYNTDNPVYRQEQFQVKSNICHRIYSLLASVHIQRVNRRIATVYHATARHAKTRY